MTTCDICDTRRGKMREDGIVRCNDCQGRRQVREPIEESCRRCGGIVDKIISDYCPTCGSSVNGTIIRT